MADISREAFTDRPWDDRRGPEDGSDLQDHDDDGHGDGEDEGGIDLEAVPEARPHVDPAALPEGVGPGREAASESLPWGGRFARERDLGRDRARALPMSGGPRPVGETPGDADEGDPVPPAADVEREPGLEEYEAEQRAAAAGQGATAEQDEIDTARAEAEAAAFDVDLDDDGIAAPTDPAALARVVLGILFVAREPLTVLRLAQVCNTSQDLVRQALEHARATLAAAGLPAEVAFAGEHITLLTAPEVFPFVKRLRGIRKPEKLSAAALETLAVIAYRQPVMRAEIEAIRGVKAGPMLRSLLEHKLVKVVGRADVPGRPLQYGTTQRFLERFGLGSLKDLPSIKEFKSL